MAEPVDSCNVCKKESGMQQMSMRNKASKNTGLSQGWIDFFPTVVTGFALHLQPPQTGRADAFSVEIHEDLLFVCTRSSTVLTNVPTQSAIQSKQQQTAVKVFFLLRKDNSFQ